MCHLSVAWAAHLKSLSPNWSLSPFSQPYMPGSRVKDSVIMLPFRTVTFQLLWLSWPNLGPNPFLLGVYLGSAAHTRMKLRTITTLIALFGIAMSVSFDGADDIIPEEYGEHSMNSMTFESIKHDHEAKTTTLLVSGSSHNSQHFLSIWPLTPPQRAFDRILLHYSTTKMVVYTHLLAPAY